MTTVASEHPKPSAQAHAEHIKDERVRDISVLHTLLSRPEFGAISGVALIFILFGIAAGDSGMFSLEGTMNWMVVAAFLGIVACGAALLMVGGEFDLSIGSMIGFAGMMMAIPCLYWGWPAWLACLFAIGCAIALGALNGWLVVRTGLPSFIVTLAFYFILRGLSLAISTTLTGKTIISGQGDLILREVIANDPIIGTLFQGNVFTGWFNKLAQSGVIQARSDGTALVAGIPKVIVWWLIGTAVGAFILAKTKFGNWILASGGDPVAAKNVGIPVARVKITLFVLMAILSTTYAILQVSDAGSAAADRGMQKEFEAIIAAVIGGCLLTGGYGSVVGAAFGALIFGMVQIGIGYTSIDNNWYRVFLGVMLLVAVLFNNFIRKRFAQGRR